MCPNCNGNSICQKGCTSKMGPPTNNTPTKEESDFLFLKRRVEILEEEVAVLRQMIIGRH